MPNPKYTLYSFLIGLCIGAVGEIINLAIHEMV
jgi:hypothetical protein